MDLMSRLMVRLAHHKSRDPQIILGCHIDSEEAEQKFLVRGLDFLRPYHKSQVRFTLGSL